MYLISVSFGVRPQVPLQLAMATEIGDGDFFLLYFWRCGGDRTCMAAYPNHGRWEGAMRLRGDVSYAVT